MTSLMSCGNLSVCLSVCLSLCLCVWPATAHSPCDVDVSICGTQTEVNNRTVRGQIKERTKRKTMPPKLKKEQLCPLITSLSLSLSHHLSLSLSLSLSSPLSLSLCVETSPIYMFSLCARVPRCHRYAPLTIQPLAHSVNALSLFPILCVGARGWLRRALPSHPREMGHTPASRGNPAGEHPMGLSSAKTLPVPYHGLLSPYSSRPTPRTIWCFCPATSTKLLSSRRKSPSPPRIHPPPTQSNPCSSSPESQTALCLHVSYDWLLSGIRAC